MAIAGKTEIALLLQRRGRASDLPDSLEEGEFGLCTDTGDLVIGAPSLSSINGRKRGEANQFPYHNIQVLTELSNNQDLIKVQYKKNGNLLKFPTVVDAYTEPTYINEEDELVINGVNVKVGENGVTINNIVDAINDVNIENLICYNVDGKLRLLMTDGSSISLNNTIENSGLIHRLGLSLDDVNVIIYNNNIVHNQSLADILSQILSVETFGIDSSNSDLSTLMNQMFISSFLSDDNYMHRKINVPAGTYHINDTIYFPKNTYLVGDGIEQTTITTNNNKLSTLVSSMDSNGKYSTQSTYGLNGAEQASNVIIENICFENISDNDVIQLTSFKNITFRHCKFKTTGSTKAKLININKLVFDDLSNIVFDDCIFEGGKYAIYSDYPVKHIQITNCTFIGIADTIIYINGLSTNNTSHVIIKDNIFNDNDGLKYYVMVGNNVDNCIIKDNYTSNNNYNKYNIVSKNVLLEQEFETTFSVSSQPQSLMIYPNLNVSIKIDYIICALNASRTGTLIVNAPNGSSGSLITNDIYDSYIPTSNRFTSSSINSAVNIFLTNDSGIKTKVLWKYRVLPISG